MGLVEEQFEALKVKDKFTQATISHNADGSYVVSIPRFSLPPGWNKTHATIYFLVPVGYPQARPDCFWSDADLMLATGAPPQNTGTQGATGIPASLKWFSWHPQSWKPNSDTLLSYIGLIQKRFQELR